MINKYILKIKDIRMLDFCKIIEEEYSNKMQFDTDFLKKENYKKITKLSKNIKNIEKREFNEGSLTDIELKDIKKDLINAQKIKLEFKKIQNIIEKFKAIFIYYNINIIIEEPDLIFEFISEDIKLLDNLPALMKEIIIYFLCEKYDISFNIIENIEE